VPARSVSPAGAPFQRITPRTMSSHPGCYALEGRNRGCHAGTGGSCSSLRRGLSDERDGPVWNVAVEMTRMRAITDAAYAASVRCAIVAIRTWNGSGRSSGDPSGLHRRSGNRCRTEGLHCNTGRTGSNRCGSGCCAREGDVLCSCWRSPLPASSVTGDTVRNNSSLYPIIAIFRDLSTLYTDIGIIGQRYVGRRACCMPADVLTLEGGRSSVPRRTISFVARCWFAPGPSAVNAGPRPCRAIRKHRDRPA